MELVGRSRRSTSSLLVLRTVARKVEVRRGHVSREYTNRQWVYEDNKQLDSL